jgi:hypothetical protein
MCDYSLHAAAMRPARVGDQLISTQFEGSLTRGFAAIGQPEVAVCLLPGTEVTFEHEAEAERFFRLFGNRKLRQRVARFRKIRPHNDYVHHDALEFPDGQVVQVHELVEGQKVRVLQLPVSEPAPQCPKTPAILSIDT